MNFSDLVLFHLFFCHKQPETKPVTKPGICAPAIKVIDVNPDLPWEEFSKQFMAQCKAQHMECKKIIDANKRPSY